MATAPAGSDGGDGTTAGEIGGNVRSLVTALQGLVESQKSNAFAKHYKPPQLFAPDTRQDELTKWGDWRFQFETFVGAIDDSLLLLMKRAEKLDTRIEMTSLTGPERILSEHLYSLLSGLMKNRPLRLIRGIPQQNGLESWRVLTKDLQPKTRQRALALVQALNRVQFDASKTITEQLPQYEAMVREYERAANVTYPDDLKVAAVVAALPQSLRVHVQMALQDDTTFDDLRSRVEMNQQVPEAGTQLAIKPGGTDVDTSAPMEVDAVWSGKEGKKGKGKGKKGQKGKWSKGKQSWSKDGKKGKGKPVRRVRLVTPTGLSTLEIFDLTEGDEENVDDDTWQEAYEVLAIKVIEEDDEVFYDCEEPIEVEVGKTGCSTFDLTSCPGEKVENEKICMVQSPMPTAVVTLDSGADVHVWHRTWWMLRANEYRRLRLIATAKDGSAVWNWLSNLLLAKENSLVMEVQVCAIRSEEDEDVVMEEKDIEMPPEVAGSGEERKNETREEKVESPEVEHAEKMSKGDVTPGYTSEDTVQQVHDDESSDGRVQNRLARWNKKLQPVKKEPIELSPEDSQGVGEMRQGLIVEGQPKFVNRPWIPFSANVIAPARACPELRGFISRELAMLESVPGWHILPNGIMVHSNPNAMHFHDPRSAFGDEWTSRMTLIKDRKGSQWQQVESLVDYRSSPAPFQPLPQGPRKILTFIATSRIRDYFGPDCEVPVSQYPLLDGESSSWPEDEEVDREGGEIPTLAAESGEQPEVREEVLFADPQEIEVQIDEEVVTMANTLKKVQEKCNMLGLATSGSKAKLLARLQKYKHREEERIAYESAKRLYAESRREAIPIKTPKLPTRFTMSVANANPIILQADGEPATKQVMRAVQHARAALGMATEIRATGAGQHASNGQAEKTVQSVRKLANTLRSFAEEKTGVKITGLHHIYPWSFRHAAWLMTRYRVINGATSFEVMNDRKYNGKVVIFGEAVLFKDTMRAKWKGEPVYRRGIWVGKSSWSDSHILLTRSGAVEARSIRRLPEQFDGNLLVTARGVPWQYSVQGLLMRSKFAARTRKANAEEEAEGNEEVLEEEAKKTGERALLVCRSDSSAARALATRVGIGRSTHIAAAMLWLQEKTMDKSIRVTGVPTAVNTSDAGTKCLSKSRLKGLKFLMKMVDENDEKIGRDEYNGIAAQEEMRKMGKAFKGSGAKVAMVIAALLRGKGEELMTTQPAPEENSGSFMWMFAFTIVLATLGALSLCQAVRAWIHDWCSKNDEPEVIDEKEAKQMKRMLSKVLSDLERKEDELMMQRKEIERLREEVKEERKEAAEIREELQEARDELDQLKDPARSGERWKEIAEQEKEKATKAIDVATGWRAKGEESKMKAETMMAKAE
ncbi:unnamed protein product [Durusdinium trenchii]